MTTTRKNAFVKFLVMLLAIISCASILILPASAATSGGDNTRTITVQTQADWSRPGTESITLKQNNCKYTYQAFSWGKWVNKEGGIYPYYKITIKNNTNGKTTTKTWHSASIKLSLNRNSNYTITVAYDWANTWYSSNCKCGNWKNSPSWWINATHKASAW